jgi:tetratricopeptide (TPR) repeat protein
MQSASRVQPNFVLNSQRASVIKICRLVGGIPLAVELAASWARSLSCEQIVAEIERGIDFLSSNLRNIPERHRSIRAVFESSWNLLSDDEQAVFRKQAVFRGGFDPTSAKQVANATLFALSALVDKSLIYFYNGRYQIHELIRQFAEEKLDEYPQEKADAIATHVAYFGEYLAERAGRLSKNLPDSSYDEVVREMNNIRAAWERSLMVGDAALMDRFLIPLYRLYDIQSRYREGETVFRSTAAVLEARPGRKDMHLVGARALLLQGACCEALTFYDEARELAEATLPVFRQYDHTEWEISLALRVIANVAYALGDYQTAESYYEQAGDVLRQIDHTSGMAMVMFRLSDIAAVFGDYEKSRRILEDSEYLLKEASGKQNEMRFSLTMGDISLKLGYLEEANAHFQQALELSDDLDAPTSAGVAYVSLGRIALAMKDFDGAKVYCLKSVELCQKIHNLWGEAFALLYLGCAHYELGDYAEAKHYYQTGISISMEIGTRFIESSILGQLAKVKLKLGDVNSAARDLHTALTIADKIKATPLILDTLLAYAHYLASIGDIDNATLTATFVMKQRIAVYIAREEAKSLLAELGAAEITLPDDLTLEAFVLDILNMEQSA